MLGEVNAHGLRRHLVVPDGLEGPAVGGVDEQDDHGDADPRQQEGREGGKAQHRLPGAVCNIEAGEGGEVFQGVGPVGDGPQLIPLEHRPDDLAKAQGGDGQIVAFQPQHRKADEPRHGGGHAAPQNQRQHHAQHQAERPAAEELRQGEVDGGAVIDIVDRIPLGNGDGQNRVGIRPQQHEARLSQGKEAREAVEQVHGHRHQGVDRAFFQGGEDHDVFVRVQHVFQDNHQRQQGRRAEEAGPGALVDCFLHTVRPLTLCR